MPSKNTPLILNRTCCKLSEEGEYKKMKIPVISICLLVLPFGSLSYSQNTVSTPVVGFENRTIPVGTSAHGHGFVFPSVYQGVAASVTANNLTVASASFTAGSFAPVNGLPTHYILITNGSSEGLVIDIVGNTTTALNVSAGDLASVSGTPTFVVRPHVKVSNIFNGNTDLQDYTDTLTVYNSDGTTSTLLRDSSATTGWINADTFAAVDSIIYPGQGYLLNASAGGSVRTAGTVSPNKVIVPIFAGLVNLVSLSNPSNGKDLQNAGLGNGLVDYTDTVVTLSSDGSLNQVVNALWAGGADGFINPDTFNPVSGVSLGGTDAVLVNSSQNTGWTVNSPLTP
jgi:hypothetical protein